MDDKNLTWRDSARENSLPKRFFSILFLAALARWRPLDSSFLAAMRPAVLVSVLSAWINWARIRPIFMRLDM